MVRCRRIFADHLDLRGMEVRGEEDIVDRARPAVFGTRAERPRGEGQALIAANAALLEEIGERSAQGRDLGRIREGVEVAHQNDRPAGMPARTEAGYFLSLDQTLVPGQPE